MCLIVDCYPISNFFISTTMLSLYRFLFHVLIYILSASQAQVSFSFISPFAKWCDHGPATAFSASAFHLNLGIYKWLWDLIHQFWVQSKPAVDVSWCHHYCQSYYIILVFLFFLSESAQGLVHKRFQSVLHWQPVDWNEWMSEGMTSEWML